MDNGAPNLNIDSKYLDFFSFWVKSFPNMNLKLGNNISLLIKFKFCCISSFSIGYSSKNSFVRLITDRLWHSFKSLLSLLLLLLLVCLLLDSFRHIFWYSFNDFISLSTSLSKFNPSTVRTFSQSS